MKNFFACALFVLTTTPVFGVTPYTSPVTGTVIDREKLDRFVGKESRFIVETLAKEGLDIIYLDPKFKGRRYDKRNTLAPDEVNSYYEVIEKSQAKTEADRKKNDAFRESLFGKMKDLSPDAVKSLSVAFHDGAYYFAPYAHSTNEKNEFVALPHTANPRIILIAEEGKYPTPGVITHEYAHYLFIHASRPKPIVYNGETYSPQDTFRLWADAYAAQMKQAQAELDKAKNDTEAFKPLARIAQLAIDMRILSIRSNLLGVLDEGDVYVFQIENYDNQKISEQLAYLLIHGITNEVSDFTPLLVELGDLNNPANLELKDLVQVLGPEGQAMHKKLNDTLKDAASRIVKITDTLGAPSSKASKVMKKTNGK